MKTPNSKSQKIRIFQEIGPLSSIIMHMYSVLGLGPFCMNYCLSAAWHGCYQPVELLRCYGRPGYFNSGVMFWVAFYSFTCSDGGQRRQS